MSLDLTNKIFRVQETSEQKRLRQLTIWKSFVVTFTLILYLTFLQQGYLDTLAHYLKANIFTWLSDGFNYIVSNIVGWIISGAIGNLFYDLLLKRFRTGNFSKDK